MLGVADSRSGEGENTGELGLLMWRKDRKCLTNGVMSKRPSKQLQEDPTGQIWDNEYKKLLNDNGFLTNRIFTNLCRRNHRIRKSWYCDSQCNDGSFRPGSFMASKTWVKSCWRKRDSYCLKIYYSFFNYKGRKCTFSMKTSRDHILN